MSRKYVFIVIMAIGISCLSGYLIIKNYLSFDERKLKNNGRAESSAQYNKKAGSLRIINDPIKNKINSMTINEKIGQMIMIGFDGYKADDNLKNMIQESKIGGVIVLGNNVKDTQQLVNLVNSIKKINSKNSIPIFISVDEEGGRVDRMPQGFVRYPSNKEIGSINKSKLSFNIGKVIGEEIKAFGFNMDFAPVLDINSNTNNPVIGDRSFGASASIVSRLGIQTMKGIQRSGIISVVKHFPGHGDTSVDSHKGLPVVYHDMARLKSFEFIPFVSAVKNGVDAVMIGHILLPIIDKDKPSSMSKVIITDTLRKQLKFNGVVITDDMTMGAITKNYGIGDASVISLIAGSDIILVCHGINNIKSVIYSIKKAVSNGAISQEKIDESVYRILKLKQKYNINDGIIDGVNVKRINSSINSVLGKYAK